MAAGWILSRRVTWFELAIAIALVMGLVTIFIGRARTLMGVAEQHRFVATVANLRTGLAVRALGLLTRGDHAAIAALARANPMGTVIDRPENYVGERSDRDAGAIPGGLWYFDPRERMLVYRVEHEDRFETDLAGPPRARLHVVLRYQERDHRPGFGAGDLFEGIGLVPVEPYRWGNAGAAG